MITLIDIKKAVNQALLEKIPDIKIYENNIKEEFLTPYFFTEIVHFYTENETINYKMNKVTIVISYFSKNKTEIENIEMIDNLRNTFNMALKVKNRFFLIENSSSNILDNILKFKFIIKYYENREKNKEEENREKMKDIKIKYESKI